MALALAHPWFMALVMLAGARSRTTKFALGAFFLLILFSLPASERLVPPDVRAAGFAIQASILDPRTLGVRRRADARLRLEEAWHLTSDNADFGGLSALHGAGHRVEAVGDNGTRIVWQMGPGHWPASIEPMPEACRDRTVRLDRDTESLAVDAESGTRWIGIEVRNAICRVDARGSARSVRPGPMADWPVTGGAEAMVRLSDGRFLIFAERDDKSEDGSAPVLLYGRDPTIEGQLAEIMRFVPPAGYRVVDAAELPDGRLLILTRRFSFPFRFSAILMMADAVAPLDGEAIKAQPIAWLSGPAGENWEGIAVEPDGPGRVRLWMVSDNNFLWLQRTLLLRFSLAVEAKPRGR